MAKNDRRNNAQPRPQAAEAVAEEQDVAAEVDAAVGDAPVAETVAEAPVVAEPQPKATEATVTMVFPRRVILSHEPGKAMTFEAGTREVPEHLVDHWYLKANGVTRYKAE